MLSSDILLPAPSERLHRDFPTKILFVLFVSIFIYFPCFRLRILSTISDILFSIIVLKGG